ncbi:MAG: type II toxin-antitoxin system prevent-host-death family antitoxin [Candidatus Atribacteria bacterium]|nr:type II toxin-antitoxin system prevent-host-death family antitoxin [Candidatus Atribacteria bacterium]
MKKVGIRELKTHLSGYIEKVKSGERLVISERLKPVAYLIPFDTLELQTIWRLVENHTLQWNGSKPKGLKEKIKLKGLKLTSQYIAEDREK